MKRSFVLALILLISSFQAQALTLSNGTTVSRVELHFLSRCSGIPVDGEVSWSLAYANCMGRVRGLSDGHMLTTSVANGKVKPLWCVPSRTEDGVVYLSVIRWINQNIEEYQRINSRYTSHIEVATVTIFRALASTYECKIA